MDMPDVTRALHRRVVDAGVQDELLASTRRGIAPVNSEPTTAFHVVHFIAGVLSPHAGRKQKRLSLAGLKGHILVPESRNRILGRAGHLDGPFALPAAALGRAHVRGLQIPVEFPLAVSRFTVNPGSPGGVQRNVKSF